MLLLFLLLFQIPYKSEIFLNKLVFHGLIKILFRLVFFEINWGRGWSENVVSIWHICLIHSTSKNTSWSGFTSTFDYVENLLNLVGLNCIKEKFCYKKVLFHYFLPAAISFLSQLFVSTSTWQLEEELLVDQNLIFQSKQILNWLKPRIWLVNFSSVLFVE